MHKECESLSPGTYADCRFLLAKFQVWYIIKTLMAPDLVDESLQKLPTYQPKDKSTRSRDHSDAVRDLKLPTEPAEVYENIMEQLVKLPTPLRILSWIYYAPKQLRMCELLEALIVKEGDTKLREERLKFKPGDVVEVCESLVVYEERSDIVRFTHYSVQEFLGQQEYLEKFLSATDLAKICLTYLGLDVFSEPCTDEDSLRDRLNQYKFLCYASQFWGYHTKGDPERSPVIQKAIFDTFTSENKLKLLIQINAYLDVNLGGCFKDPSTTKTVIFHILASNGLATLFKILLDGTNKYISV